MGSGLQAAAQSRQIPREATAADLLLRAIATTATAADVATHRVSVAVQHLKAQRRHAVVDFAGHDERVRRRRRRRRRRLGGGGGGGGGGRQQGVVGRRQRAAATTTTTLVVGAPGGGGGARCEPAADARVVGQDRQGYGERMVPPARQVEDGSRRRRARVRGSDAVSMEDAARRRLQFSCTMTPRVLRLFQPDLVVCACVCVWVWARSKHRAEFATYIY